MPDLIVKPLSRDHFLGIPGHLKYHHLILLRECAKAQGSSKFSQKRLTDKVNREFLDFLDRTLGINNMQFKLDGLAFLNVWSTDKCWEMMLKLSDEFPHHYAGILLTNERQ